MLESAHAPVVDPAERADAAGDGPALATEVAQDGERNTLLRALPPDAYAEVLSIAEIVPLTVRDCVQQPGAPVQHVYFPQNGIISTVVVMQDGARVECYTAGREGMAPLSAAMGDDRASTESFVQLNGTARRLSAEDFARFTRPGAALRDIAERYARATFVQIAQAVACNRLHSVERRCARWLLIAHDRVDGDAFSLTHEFLAMMLGVRRAGVSVAAETLQAAGLISYRRGRISIEDRSGLEAASCECYAAVRAETERLLGPTLGPRRPATVVTVTEPGA